MSILRLILHRNIRYIDNRSYVYKLSEHVNVISADENATLVLILYVDAPNDQTHLIDPVMYLCVCSF